MGLDPLQRKQSQLGNDVDPRNPNLGIEGSDPRWSHRDRALRRIADLTAEEDPHIDLGDDRSQFKGAPPGDPFEVLIQRRDEGRQRQKREREPQQPTLDTGLAPLDEALGGLDEEVYLVCGPLVTARAFVHQIACHVAAGLPVVYLTYRDTPRALTLQALARLGSGEAPDLARGRGLADAFRPIRERLHIVEGTPDESVHRLRARLQQLLRQTGSRQGLLVVDDLASLAHPPELAAVVPKADQAIPARWKPPQSTEATPEELASTLIELTSLAEHIHVPVLVVSAAIEGAGVRMLFEGPLKRGGPVQMRLEGLVPRAKWRRSGPAPLRALMLDYEPKRGAFSIAKPVD